MAHLFGASICLLPSAALFSGLTQKKTVFDQAAQICHSPQGQGEQKHKTEKGEGHEGLHTAAWIFKEPPMPRVLGVLASVLIANANILAAAAAPSGGRLEALTAGQTSEPCLLILYI